MFTLKLDEIIEEGLDLKWEEERASLLAYLKDLSRIDFDFEAPLQSEARIRKAGRLVFITGRIQTILRLQCVRCLKEFAYPLSTTFELALHPLKEAPSDEETELGSEEMEMNFFEGGERSIFPKSLASRFFWRSLANLFVRRDVKGFAQYAGKISTSLPVSA